MIGKADNNVLPIKNIREIRINPIVPSESVLVATARSMRPKKKEAPVQHDPRPHLATLASGPATPCRP